MESFVWQDIENAVRWGTAKRNGKGIVLMGVMDQTLSFDVAEAIRVRDALNKAIERAKERGQ